MRMSRARPRPPSGERAKAVIVAVMAASCQRRTRVTTIRTADLDAVVRRS